jgi:hypothetical protein
MSAHYLEKGSVDDVSVWAVRLILPIRLAELHLTTIDSRATLRKDVLGNKKQIPILELTNDIHTPPQFPLSQFGRN